MSVAFTARLQTCAALALMFCAFTPGGADAQTRRALPRADGAGAPLLDYAPSGATGCAPTLILSHGFGGDETGLGGLAKSMSTQGWRVLAMGHRESGRDQLRGALLRGGLAAIDAAARERDRHSARFLDLDAAVTEATRACRPPTLVLAGHSMGSQTTMMEAGAIALIGAMGRDRFDAYIALSPQGVGTTYGAGAWANVRKPVLMITGTNDRVIGADYTARLTAFEGLPAGRKRLAVLQGAGHLHVGGVGSAAFVETINKLVAEFTVQVSAKSWAASHGFGARISEK